MFDDEYATGDISRCVSTQSSEIRKQGEAIGIVEVGYPEPVPSQSGEPFLPRSGT